MSAIIKIILLLLIPAISAAQTNTIDSLTHVLKSEKQDTGRVLLLAQLSRVYTYSRPDTALALAQQGLLLAKKTDFTKGEAKSLTVIAIVFLITGNYPKALQLQLEALKKAEAIKDEETVGRLLSNIGITYTYQGDYRQGVNYTLKALALAEAIKNEKLVSPSLLNLGNNYEKLNRLDSALSYTSRAYDLAVQLKEVDGTGIALNNLGNIYSKMGKDAMAMDKYRASLPLYIQEEDDEGLCEAYLGMAKLFQKSGNTDSSLYYAKLSLTTGKKAGIISRVMDASNFLTSYYTAIHNVDSAFVYQSATIAAKDSLFSQEKAREIQSLSYDETVRQQQIEEAKQEARTQVKFNMLFGSIATLLIVAFLLFRNNRQREKANVLLTQQKEKVESTLQELKAAQAQLVQSEKMASLGELTAGIAHEIQNPLNFVNNFAQLNKEMLVELREELAAGNYEEVKNIASDVEANEEKIVHHGRRADSIVKGMLQHSRHSTGEKEPTNINAVAEEYLRLALFGLKTKDKTFNATLKTDFDKSIGKVAVVPQDIGRVLLNLFNNAFYAVNEKRKQRPDGYEPTVSVTTKKLDGKIEIHVQDNGMGISESLVNKIFQPFFTTKPAGQGTGLGLSLSYDIIKAHGGELKVESKEGEGALFAVLLPLTAPV